MLIYLQQHDPEGLRLLKAQFPNHSLTPASFDTLASVSSRTAGEESFELDETTPEAQDEISLRLAIARQTLKRIYAKAETVLPAFRRRLSSLKTWQFASQILIALSGASLLTTLGETSPLFTMIAGGLALLGSLITIYAQYRSTGLGEGTGSLTELYTKLVEKRAAVLRNLRELEVLSRFGAAQRDPQEVADIIQDSDNLSEEVGRILDFVNLP